MTDRLTALRELLAKVEADALHLEPYGGMPLLTAMYRHFDKGAGRWSDRLAMDAYWGALDAAKALHEAVLPGWEWGVTCNKEQPDGPAAFVAEWGDYQNGFEATNDTPARAWLIAILRALIAQETSRD